jgi:hypothetical protein
MKKPFSKTLMPLGQHGVHLLFKSFGGGVVGWRRELVCNVATMTMIIVPALAAFFLVDLYAGKQSATLPFSQIAPIVVGGAVAFTIAMRICAWLFNRLSPPLDWAVAPLPILITSVVWLIFMVTRMADYRAAHTKIGQYLLPAAIPDISVIVIPIFVCVFGVAIYGCFLRMSKLQQMEISQAEMET